jgi:hypothetical protein
MNYIRPIIVVMLFSIVVIYSFHNSKSFQECINQEHTTSSDSQANDDISGVIRLIPIYHHCGLEIVDKKHDLVIAAFTIVLAVFTIFLWFATLDAATAGKQAAIVAEQALVKLERAFISIDGFNVELNAQLNSGDQVPTISYFAVQPKWINSGSTPPKRMTIRVCWHNPGQPFLNDYSYRFAPMPFFVPPKAVEGGEFVEMTGGQALIDYGWKPVGPEPLMLIWGRANYEDIFNRRHFIEWCYRVRFDRHDGKTISAHLIQWGDYNRSD